MSLHKNTIVNTCSGSFGGSFAIQQIAAPSPSIHFAHSAQSVHPIKSGLPKWQSCSQPAQRPEAYPDIICTNCNNICKQVLTKTARYARQRFALCHVLEQNQTSKQKVRNCMGSPPKQTATDHANSVISTLPAFAVLVAAASVGPLMMTGSPSILPHLPDDFPLSQDNPNITR